MFPPSGVYATRYEEDTAIVRTKTQWVLTIVGLIVLFTMPLFIGSYLTKFITHVAIVIVAVQGINILTGYCGQITLGHAAFMAVGGYISAILSVRYGLPIWVALPCSALGAGLVGALVGLPSLRVKGLYLALATVAAQFIIHWAILNNPEWTGGTSGLILPYPEIGGFVIDTTMRFYYLAIPVMCVMVLFAKNLARTGVGRAFISIRDNDKAAESIGINLAFYKTLAFFIGCLFAGVAGSLWAYYAHHITIEGAFTFMDSIWYVGMAIVGGLGSTVGIIFGVIFILGLNQLVLYYGPAISDTFSWAGTGLVSGMLAFLIGLVIIVFLIFEPRGLAHRWEMFKASYRLHPYDY